jgi:hypothetical protein
LACSPTPTVFLDDVIFRHFADCADIWQVRDFGTSEVLDALKAFKPMPLATDRKPQVLRQRQSLNRQIFRARLARPGMKIPAGGRYGTVPEGGLYQVNRRAAIQRV